LIQKITFRDFVLQVDVTMGQWVHDPDIRGRQAIKGTSSKGSTFGLGQISDRIS